MEESNKQIAVQNNEGNEKNLTPQQLNTIKNTVAIGANDDELMMFLTLSAKYDLDPFAKEIWCIKMKDKALIMTSRDGYLKIANRNPHYRGMISDAIYSNDKFMKSKNGVEHSYTANRGQIIGAYACVYRDDRDVPAYFFAPFRDYYKRGGTWDTYPHAMIVKVAESMALKRAFSISGLVTEEEMSIEQQQQQEQRPQQPQQNTTKNTAQDERKTQIRQLWNRYLAVCDNQREHAQNAMTKVTGKEKSEDYTNEDIKALFADIIRREDEKMNAELAGQQHNAIDVDEITTQNNSNEDSTN